MKILALASYYPNKGRPFAGTFNEKNVVTLKSLCDSIEVLAPRPYVPPLFAPLNFRWKAYSEIPYHEFRNGVSVYRPAYLQLPRVASAYWTDRGAFLFSKKTAREMHKRVGFDAIVSFDLLGTGGIAWRLGSELGIPASGWGYGRDLAQPAGTSGERIVLEALHHLDLIFYQSHELLETASGLLGLSPEEMLQDRHMVLAHGIPEPPILPRGEIRNRIRKAWGIKENQVLVLNIGRVTREKGVFELLEALSRSIKQDPRITCRIVGSHNGFDETTAVLKKLDQSPFLRKSVKLLPSCTPDQVWEYLCAADIFAFPSRQRFEGMPNSLLEAMVMGVPAIAFAIRPVLEIEAGTGSLLQVPPFNTNSFAEAILRLAASPAADLAKIGEIGRAQVLNRFMVQKNMALALKEVERTVQERKRMGSITRKEL